MRGQGPRIGPRSCVVPFARNGYVRNRAVGVGGGVRVAWVLALGIAAAVGASVLYNTSIALQALEARDVPGEHSLRISLIGRLLRNRKWLGATALGLLGWPLEIVALLLAPLTVVQPCLASGLIVLLWLGVTQAGGERPGRASTSPWPRSSPASPGSPGRRPTGPPSTPAPGRSRSPWAWSRSRSPLPTCCGAAASARGHAGGRQRRLRLRLDRDRQQAADRRAGGRDAAGRGRLAGDRGRPRRGWRCSAR